MFTASCVDQKTRRVSGKKTQIGNIQAAKVVEGLPLLPHSHSHSLYLLSQVVADVIRTCLGPRAMLKVWSMRVWGNEGMSVCVSDVDGPNGRNSDD